MKMDFPTKVPVGTWLVRGKNRVFRSGTCNSIEPFILRLYMNSGYQEISFRLKFLTIYCTNQKQGMNVVCYLDIFPCRSILRFPLGNNLWADLKSKQMLQIEYKRDEQQQQLHRRLSSCPSLWFHRLVTG